MGQLPAKSAVSAGNIVPTSKAAIAAEIQTLIPYDSLDCDSRAVKIRHSSWTANRRCFSSDIRRIDTQPPWTNDIRLLVYDKKIIAAPPHYARNAML